MGSKSKRSTPPAQDAPKAPEQLKPLLVTPEQRWTLYNLSLSSERKVKGAEAGQAGRRERRFARALGLDLIRQALRDSDDHVSTERIRERTPALFRVTDEIIDHLAKLAEVGRHPQVDLVLGELFDQVDDHKAGREVQLVGEAFVSDESAWIPSDEDDAEYLARTLKERVGHKDARAILLQAVDLLPPMTD